MSLFLKLPHPHVILPTALFLSASLLVWPSAPTLANFGDPCAKYIKGSKKWKRCKRPRNLPNLHESKINFATDDERFMAGYWLAKNGRYQQAITVLSALENKNDPRVLNYIGYSTRKLGRVQDALAYYKKAIAIKPDYVMSRAYLGEAYLVLGNKPAAHHQLSQIANRCGTSCEAYRSLHKKMDLADAL